MDKFKRKDGEIVEAYISRLYAGKVENNLTNREIADIINTELSTNYQESYFRGIAKNVNIGREIERKEMFSDNVDLQKSITKLEEKMLELKKERKKNQAVNVELNKRLREQGRSEVYIEQMIDAIESLEPLEIPKIEIINSHNYKEGIVGIADSHFGKEVVIKDLNGNIINEFNEKVFENRMWDLGQRILDIIEEEKLTKIHIMFLGDLIDGILRISQLQSLEYGVVDSTIKVSEFLATWVNTLSVCLDGKCFIEVHSVGNGNHSQIRSLTGKKGDFPSDNVEKIIIKFIEARLKDNKNVLVNIYEHDKIFTNICGLNVLGTHGESKDLSTDVNYIDSLYGIKVGLLLAGHLHKREQATISVGKLGDVECFRVPSICGIDDFSVELKKSANAGATAFIIEEGKGKTKTYDIVLK